MQKDMELSGLKKKGQSLSLSILFSSIVHYYAFFFYFLDLFLLLEKRPESCFLFFQPFIFFCHDSRAWVALSDNVC